MSPPLAALEPFFFQSISQLLISSLSAPLEPVSAFVFYQTNQNLPCSPLAVGTLRHPVCFLTNCAIFFPPPGCRETMLVCLIKNRNKKGNKTLPSSRRNWQAARQWRQFPGVPLGESLVRFILFGGTARRFLITAY